MTIRNLAERMNNRTQFIWNVQYHDILNVYGEEYPTYDFMGCTNGEDVLTKLPDEILDMYEIACFSISEDTVYITAKSYEFVEWDKERRVKK